MVRTEILSTFHAQVKYISVQKIGYAIQTTGGKKTESVYSSLGTWTPI